MRVTDHGGVSTEEILPRHQGTARGEASRPISVVLRVIPQAAFEGRIAGRIEVVDTGESIAIRDLDELVERLRQLASARIETDEDTRPSDHSDNELGRRVE